MPKHICYCQRDSTLDPENVIAHGVAGHLDGGDYLKFSKGSCLPYNTMTRTQNMKLWFPMHKLASSTSFCLNLFFFVCIGGLDSGVQSVCVG
jgi:hypothetical protein